MTSVDAGVIVAGAGPAGLATARSVALAGYPVLLLDGAPLDEHGSGLTLWPNALRALRELGVPDLAEVGVECDGMRTVGPDGTVLQAQDATAMRQHCGGNGVGLTRRVLIEHLRAVLPDSVTVERSTVRDVATAAASELAVASTSSGHRVGRVIVGADGARSRVRDAIGPTRDRDLGLCVVRGLSSLELSPYPGELSLGRGTQFGIFPVRGGTYWFAAYPRRREEADVPSTLGSLFAEWHPPVPDLLATTPPDQVLRHEAVDRPLRGRWGRDRLTLVGDAAHLAAPTLGQGTCQALEDAAALGRAVAGGLGPEQLRRFERSRRPRAASMVRQAHLLAVTGQWRHRWVCALRDTALRSTPVRAQQRQLRDLFDVDDQC